MQGDNTLPYRSYPDLLKFSFACEGRFPRERAGTLSRMSIRGGQVQGDNTLPYLSPCPKEVWYLFEGPPIAPWPDTVGCWWSWCMSVIYTCERKSDAHQGEFPWLCRRNRDSGRGNSPLVSAMISMFDMWTVQVQGDLTLPYLPVRSIKGMWIAGQTGAAPAFFSGWIDQPRYPVCVRCCYA